MTAIAVTGAAGSVGHRVIRLLAGNESVDTIKAVDRAPVAAIPGNLDAAGADVERHRMDLAAAALPEVLAGCRTVVHLAEDPGRRTDERVAMGTLDDVLTAADQAGCRHVVLLSSALVYGARADNPVPLTEHHRRAPERRLTYATTKARLEEVAESWAESDSNRLAVLRPTTTLSERGVSYIAGALREATSLRPEHATPPVQFLHHDDLAAAVSLVAVEGMADVYNVAPDGWIGPDLFHDLQVEAALRLPESIDDVRSRAAALLRRRRLDDGIEPYVRHPWVVASDRLRAAGWQPAFSNEEAFVLGHPAPAWQRIAQRHRQELALGVVGAAAMGALGAAGLLATRAADRLRP